MLNRHRFAFVFVALAGAVLDLVSKHFAHLHIARGDNVEIIPGFFSFGNTINKGMVFGMLQNAGPLLLIISIIAVPIILVIFWRMKEPKWIMSVTLGLILAGTLGNLFDRVAFGHVRDFIRVYVQSDAGIHEWPLFNIADSCICVGVVLLSLEMMFFDASGRAKKAAEPALPSAEETVPMPVSDSDPTRSAPIVGEEIAPIPRPEEPGSERGDEISR